MVVVLLCVVERTQGRPKLDNKVIDQVYSELRDLVKNRTDVDNKTDVSGEHDYHFIDCLFFFDL